jgi:hypothetical protein
VLLACTPLNSEQSELVALLEAGTAHVVSIIEDILLHGALVSGSFSVAREPLDLARAVLDPAWRMICMQHSQRAKMASLRMRRDVADDVPAVIVGDSTRLIQVVTNILSNSIKFTPEGGDIHLQVSVTDEAPASASASASASAFVDADAQGAPGERPRWLCFAVTDTGIGVEPGACCCCSGAAARSLALTFAHMRPLCSQAGPYIPPLRAGGAGNHAAIRRHWVGTDGALVHCVCVLACMLTSQACMVAIALADLSPHRARHGRRPDGAERGARQGHNADLYDTAVHAARRPTEQRCCCCSCCCCCCCC